jgi:RNA polymerase sigma factor (sigma-70 family)
MAVDPARDAAGRLVPEAAGAYLAELFEEHGRMVYGVCRLMLRDRTDAEDAAQQSFLSAYRSLVSGHEPRHPGPWLATIARNECRGRIRGRMTEPLALVDDSFASAADVEGVVAQREEVAVLCAALAELPHTQRDAIVLREFYGLSYEEVSAVLGVSAPAVDALLVRARRRLQVELRPARLASGAVVLPLTVGQTLAEAVPGFATSASATGFLAKLASLPIAAKLAGATATVAVVAVVGSGGPPEPRASATEGASQRSAAALKPAAALSAEGDGGVVLAAAPAHRKDVTGGSASTRRAERDDKGADEDVREPDDEAETDEIGEELEGPDGPDDDRDSSSGPESEEPKGPEDPDDD